MKFSLDWFKTKKKEQETEEKLSLLNEGLQDLVKVVKDMSKREPVIVSNDELENVLNGKQYSKAWLTNGTLGVVTKEGNILTKQDATTQDYEAVKKARTEEEILFIFTPKEEFENRKKEAAEFERVRKIREGFAALQASGDFEVVDNKVYLKGIKRSLPKLLVNKFFEVLSRPYGTDVNLAEDVNYQSLKRFWYWCCLNPRAEVADELYDFLERNSFKFTKQGFFAALRNVVTVESGNKELVEFVSNSYNKIKAIWKKKPSDYLVLEKENGEKFIAKAGSITDVASILGNLQELYLDLPNMKENRYTDNYTKTFDIRVGKAVWMDPKECSWSKEDCGKAGLHFTANEISYVGCGDTSVLVLINPMKVVGIGSQKGRCYEYFPIMTVPANESTKILHDLDFDTLELDEIYAQDEIKDLEQRAKEGFAVEAKKYNFNLPSITSNEVAFIVKTLEQIKKEMSGRVKEAVEGSDLGLANVDYDEDSEWGEDDEQYSYED